jgi:hypothetical protein
MNEREFIARVEAANTEELTVLSRPSPEEDRVLSTSARSATAAPARAALGEAAPRRATSSFDGIMGGS